MPGSVPVVEPLPPTPREVGRKGKGHDEEERGTLLVMNVVENIGDGNLGGGFKYMFYFHLYLGKISNLTIIFFRWVVQPPTRNEIPYI